MDGNLVTSSSSNAYTIVKNTAAETFSEEGNVVSAGGHKTRVELGNDPRFRIAATVIKDGDRSVSGAFKKIYARLFCVKLGEQNGTSIYVNVNSLASRLHIAKDVVRQSKNVSDLVEPKLEHQAKIINSYEAIFKQCQVNEEGKFSFERSGEHVSTDISPKMLMNVISATVPILFKNGPSAPSDASSSMKIGTFVFVAKKLDGDQVGIMFSTSKKLGLGKMGVAYRAYDLNTKEALAYKEAKPNKDAYEDIKKEYEMLKELHTNHQPVRGIQDLPHTFVHIGDQENPDTVGIMMPLYEGGDLNKNQSQDLNTKQKLGLDVLYGLEYLHNENRAHMDLKSANVFVEVKPDKLPEAKIADLGGASRLSKTIPSKEDMYMADASYSATYLSPRCHIMGEAAFYEAQTGKQIKRDEDGTPLRKEITVIDSETKEQSTRWEYQLTGQSMSQSERIDAKNESNKYLLRNDLFAAGATLYELYTGQLPYTVDEETDRPDTPQFKAELLKEKGVPEPIIKLIEEMVTPDEHPNLTAAQACQRYKAALS